MMMVKSASPKRSTAVLIMTALLAYLHISATGQTVATSSVSSEYLVVHRAKDFTITGDGSNPEWNNSDWTALVKLDAPGSEYKTRFKVLYSSSGIYVLFHGIDNKITTHPDYQDFDPIFNADVFEVFLHPDPAVMVYFEYEVNAMSKELILAISNLNGKNHSSWIPSGKSKSGIRKMVSVEGGQQTAGATIMSWKAEIFLPFGALGLLPHVPPEPGSVWNANFCRLDYDSGEMVKWSWSPDIKKSFHELDKFHSLKFE